MDLGLGKMGVVAVVETCDVLWVPATATDSLVIIEIVTGKEVGKSGIERGGDGGGEDLVAVEGKDPIMSGEAGGEIAQGAKADEGMLDDPDVGVGARESEGGVGRTVIEDEHFGKGASGIERGLESGGRIFCQNAN